MYSNPELAGVLLLSPEPHFPLLIWKGLDSDGAFRLYLSPDDHYSYAGSIIDRGFYIHPVLAVYVYETMKEKGYLKSPKRTEFTSKMVLDISLIGGVLLTPAISRNSEFHAD
jgi:hypothetical protein